MPPSTQAAPQKDRGSIGPEFVWTPCMSGVANPTDALPALVASLVGFAHLHLSRLVFVSQFLVPDLSFAAYSVGPRIGAATALLRLRQTSRRPCP
jgi:hypothetical protein